jgi:hypothetical protein
METCPTARSGYPISFTDQQLPKGLDFTADEVTESPHTWRALHIAMNEQIEWKSEFRYRAKQSDEVGLSLDSDDRKR